VVPVRSLCAEFWHNLRFGSLNIFMPNPQVPEEQMNELRIETERLILRMYRLSDFEDHFKLCADPNVMRYLLGGKPMSRLEAWRHMAFLVGHWELLGYGYFVAEEKSSGRFVGRIGFTNPEGWPGFELGWTIAPEFQGRGLATEGARRLLDYAFNEMGRDHVISVINPENKPSIKVAERLGEKLEGSEDVAGVRMLIYGIDRPKR
jgi:RimJ/RimL family protein N-acetyltransferase